MRYLMEELVKKYHSQQLRNDPEDYLSAKIPYTDHLTGVESVLRTVLKKTGEIQDDQLIDDMCNAALGHDLLEDTDVSESEIEKETNEHVLKLIKELTNPADDSHTEQYLQQLANASEEAKLIKYADLIENTASVAYNYYNLGEQWVAGFYMPILNSTEKVLRYARYLLYPRTADLLQKVLAVNVDLLEEKRREKFVQYPFKAVDTTVQYVSDKTLNAIIQENYAAIREACKAYIRNCKRFTGMEEELKRGLIKSINGSMNKAFHDLTKGHFLENRLDIKNRESWKRFIDDYNKWKNNEKPVSTKGDIWLRYRFVPDGRFEKTEASYLDKIQFFKLMEAFYIPADRFMAFGEGVRYPDYRHRMYADGPTVFVNYRNLNYAEGAQPEEYKSGDEAVLIDQNGLKAVIQITDHFTLQDDGNYNDREKDENGYYKNPFGHEYAGIGTIEGYTSDRKRKIWFTVDNKTAYLVITAKQDDIDAFFSFPMWKDAHKHKIYIDTIRNRTAETLFEHFLEEARKPER